MSPSALSVADDPCASAPALPVQAEPRWDRAGAGFDVKAGGRELRAFLLQDQADLDRLRAPWKALSENAAAQSAFLTWDWLSTWARRFVRNERRLFVIAVVHGSDLVAIAPWYIDLISAGPVRLRQVGFLGVPEAGSDYLDVIVAKGREKLAADALVALLCGPLSSAWDTMALKDIPADSVFLSRFISELRRRGKHYIVDEGSFCPGVRLPPTFDAYLAQLSSHGRQAYRRKMRALQAGGSVEHVTAQEDGDVRGELATFRRLYERRWGHNQAADDLFALLNSYLQLADRAWHVEVSLLQVGGTPVAGLVHLTSGRTMYQYLMAVDRTFNPAISIGNLICGMNIERAIDEGFHEYDFLKSEEEYKFQFMTRGRRAMNLTLHNRTARSVIAWSVRAAQSLGKILLR